MRNVLLAAAVISSSIALASPATAATVINFASPGGNLGTSETYNVAGYTVTAYGFSALNAAQDLFGKNAGAGETGLGFNINGDKEIGFGEGYVQLDVSQLLSKVSMISFGTNSTTDGETWAVYGSNSLGSLGSFLSSGTTEVSNAALPNLGAYNFYSFASIANKGGANILIKNLTLTPSVPEPATWMFMLVGMAGVGYSMRRKDKLTLRVRYT